MLRTKQAISFLMLVLSPLFLAEKSVQAEPIRIMENLRREIVLLPSGVPDRNQLSFVSSVAVESEAQVVSILASYDDPTTKRPLDYVELYDAFGGLLLVGWVDPFGIRRLAMDSGLLRAEGSELERVLVLIADGTPS